MTIDELKDLQNKVQSDMDTLNNLYMSTWHESSLLDLIDAEIKRQKPCEDCADGHDILAANKQCEPVTVNYCPNCGRKMGDANDN